MRINKSITTLLLFSLSMLSNSSSATTCTGLKECPEPVKKLQRFANLKVPEAQLVVGMLYRQGVFYQDDQQKAFKWIKRAARQEFHYALAQHLFGRAYLYGEGVEVNRARAVRYLKRAAKLGLVDSQRILGKEYYSGKILAVDLEKAKSWLLAAANQRDYAATIQLIQLLRRSEVRDDLREAEYWAAESENMHVNVRDISESVELDLELIEKVVERSELWVSGDRPFNSKCVDQNGEWIMGCGPEIKTDFRFTRPYRRVLDTSQVFEN